MLNVNSLLAPQSGAHSGLLGDHLRTSSRACMGHHLGHVWALYGARLGHHLGHHLRHVWGMSGASSGACLGHHLGHVWGNIWGITHPHPPHSHTHFQHTVGVHFLTSNTLMREKLQLHTQVAYLFQTKTSTISDIQHGHYLVLVPHVGPLHDPPGGFSSKPSVVHLCLLLLL